MDIIKLFEALIEIYKARGIDLTFKVKKKGEDDDAFIVIRG